MYNKTFVFNNSIIRSLSSFCLVMYSLSKQNRSPTVLGPSGFRVLQSPASLFSGMPYVSRFSSMKYAYDTKIRHIYQNSYFLLVKGKSTKFIYEN